MVEVYFKDKVIATFSQDAKKYLIDYKDLQITNSISLSLPNTKRFYTYDYRFPPYFEMFLPEGYLYEIFKNILTKEHGYIDDYLIFSKLASNIKNRVVFKTDFKKLQFDIMDIEEILHNDTKDTFATLLKMFLDKNAISGVQPKTVALLREKETLYVKEYIIKTWGDEYPNLAENEYFCLQALRYAGVKTADVELSKNRRFLVVENFIFEDDKILGFEEILSLMDKNRDNKYDGSYEQIAKVIYQFSTFKKKSLEEYFKVVVMNYLLKNGDAHLKNFGLLFNEDFTKIWFSPAYDVVNTTAYIFKDRPALMLDGKKVWVNRKTLCKFGKNSCLLSQKEAETIYDKCIEAVYKIIKKIESYYKENPSFKIIGQRMCDSFRVSLEDQTIKELPDELTGTWS
jgi:serine/threonine-protein kinase HipA